MFDKSRMLEILKVVKKCKASRVFIQVPEGLKMNILDLASYLGKNGIDVVVSIEPCFGACDLKDKEAKDLGCDLLLHIGHSDLGLKTKIPVIYDEFRMDFNPVPLLKKNLGLLKNHQKMSLLTTVQFLDSLEKAKKFLESENKKVFIGNPNKAKYPGQILGCDHSSATSVDNTVDCHLFVGSGLFHPLGLAMKVKKPILFLDFESGKLVDLSKEKIKLEIKKFARIEKAKDFKNFGILISTKPGQIQLKTARSVKKKLESLGKHAWILAADNITPEMLLGLKIDCLVNCACPRFTEDFEMFKKIILDPEDVERL
jgi:2-(3-amino-3-carboxypropyl)histidine synthase